MSTDARSLILSLRYVEPKSRALAVRKRETNVWAVRIDSPEILDGSRIVVGSFAGAVKHPAWYLNLADKAANPEVYVRHRDEQYWAEANVLDGEEYSKTWAALTNDRPFYKDYQAKTERRIPLIRLVSKRPAEGAPE